MLGCTLVNITLGGTAVRLCVVLKYLPRLNVLQTEEIQLLLESENELDCSVIVRAGKIEADNERGFDGIIAMEE